MNINAFILSSNVVEPITIFNIYTHAYKINWLFCETEDGWLIKLAILKHKPTIEEIKNLILEDINSSIDSKILEGYTWKDYLVWLSLENLFNYKAAYDIATLSNGAIGLPVTFKFTDPTTQNPVYYTFNTLEDLQDFYLGAVNHINTTLEEGWRLKDTFDFSPYEEWLKEHANNN